MIHTHIFKSFITLFMAFALFAQSQETIKYIPKDSTAFLYYNIASGSTAVVRLENGHIRWDFGKYTDYHPVTDNLTRKRPLNYDYDYDYDYDSSNGIVRDALFQRYYYKGKEYRMLSKSELKQYDAMHRLKVRGYSIYFDDKPVKPYKRFPISRIWEAYYWEDGIIILGRRKGLLGNGVICFFRPGQDKMSCMGINLEFFNYKAKLGFLVPTKIDRSNKDLLFDVKMPEKISSLGTLPLRLSLTNVSGRPILVPDSLKNGFGKANWDINQFTLTPDHKDVSQEKVSWLSPGETRETDVYLSVVNYFLHANYISAVRDGSHNPYKKFQDRNVRVSAVFYWDGFLNEGDRHNITRFAVKKFIEFEDTPSFQVDESNRDLKLEVKVQNRSTRHPGADFVISLTNVSSRPILVPDSLEDGFGIHYFFKTGLNFLSKYDHSYPKYPIFHREMKTSLLMPGEKRTGIYKVQVGQWWGKPIYFWEGFLDNDFNTLTRFQTKKKKPDVYIYKPRKEITNWNPFPEMFPPNRITTEDIFEVIPDHRESF